MLKASALLRGLTRRRTSFRALTAIVAIGFLADHAFAGGFLGFWFFTETLATLFFLPFQIAGCG